MSCPCKKAVNIFESASTPYRIGKTGENVYQEIEFNFSKWLSEYPDAKIDLLIRVPKNGFYLLAEGITESIYVWKPSAFDLANPGRASVMARMSSGEVRAKSDAIPFEIVRSMDYNLDISEPGPTRPSLMDEWIEDIYEAAARYPKIGEEDGYWYVWDVVEGEWKKTDTYAGGGSGGSTIYTTPEKYGAVGDGVTDDTAAVRQAMQNPAVALQKTYKVTEVITCAAQLVQGIDGGGIVSSSGGLVFANDARLLDFSASLPHGYAGNVIEAKGSVYADGLTVTGGKVGILASGQYKSVEIRNCFISDQWGESSRGIYIPFAGETFIEGNTVDTVTNDTTVNADGISVWQSKEETHPVAVIRGNTIHNCRGRFLKASTRDALIEANYCYNDSDFDVIPYFVAVDVQNGCSIVRGNTVIAPSGINVSLRDTAGLHSVHAIEYNKLTYNGVSASNKTLIATTDYANGSASSQVSIVGNDISARADNSASIQLAYVPNAKYNVYNNRVRGGTWYAMQMKGTFDATTRFEVLGNTNADYVYFARFVGGMPNVKGDRTARCETALDFASVLKDTSFTANTAAIDGFTNTAFVQGHDGATGYWIELWDGTEVGGYKTNGQQIFYHKQGDKHVSTVNGLSGDVTLTIPTVPDMATDPDMGDWDTGKTVDAAVLKTGLTLVGNVLSRKANASDIPTAVSELTNDSGYQTAQDVQTAIASIPDELPTVTASDNGKILRVVNGAWAAQTVPSAEGASF